MLAKLIVHGMPSGVSGRSGIEVCVRFGLGDGGCDGWRCDSLIYALSAPGGPAASMRISRRPTRSLRQTEMLVPTMNAPNHKGLAPKSRRCLRATHGSFAVAIKLTRNKEIARNDHILAASSDCISDIAASWGWLAPGWRSKRRAVRGPVCGPG
jgi:hypothetical protein